VQVSFYQPEYTADVDALGTLRLLEAVRDVAPKARFYQASSSEMYGKAPETPQSERTPFRPRSPYACAKVYGFWQTINYREAYGIHASNGILFNHESPLRGENFVTRKITRAVGRIKLGLQKQITLGNLDACRDWGYAPEYVEAMWMMLQQPDAGDYVIATGEMHSVREFCEVAFSMADLDYRDHVRTDPAYLRPSEVISLRGDASKAQRCFGWKPRTDFKTLVRLMVAADLVIPPGGRHTSLFLSHDPESLVSNESVQNYDATEYSSPILGNRLSFEEAGLLAEQLDPVLLEKRWKTAWSACLL
jgi:GDPmannose 4,6-dehydratase